MYCRKCGTKNDNEASFCKNCGAELNALVEQSTKKVSNTDSLKTNKNRSKIGKKISTIIILLVIILGTAWLYNYLFVAKPKEVVSTYFSLVSDLKVNEAMALEYEDDTAAYNAVSGIFGKMSGVNINDLTSLLPYVKDSVNTIKFRVNPTSEKLSINFIKNENISSIVSSIIPLLANNAEVTLNYEIINPDGNVRTQGQTTIILKKSKISWKIADEKDGNINQYLKEFYTGSTK